MEYKIIWNKNFMNKINNKDITIIIQGSTLVEYHGKRCIYYSVESVKRTLPGAKIIISTWEGENIPDDIVVDKIIYNNDPGFKTRNGKPNGKPNNVNRQIVSTLNGLKQTSTKYAMKLRSDFILTSKNFIKYFDIFQEFNKEYQIFEKRIICPMTGTRKPRAKNYNLPFHIADFATFGLTKDLVRLYDIPLVTDEEFDWFLIHNEFKPDCYAVNKYNAEQSIWINCLRKVGKDIKCQYSTHVNDEIAEQSDKFLVNNFYPVTYKKYGIKPLKKNLLPKNNIVMYTDYYTQTEWKKLYSKYLSKIKMGFDIERFVVIKALAEGQSLNTMVLRNFAKFIFSKIF